MDGEMVTVSGKQLELVKDREVKASAGYERPEVSRLAMQQEVTELQHGCGGKCRITQAVSVPTVELVRVVTECATCGRKRNADFKPPKDLGPLA